MPRLVEQRIRFGTSPAGTRFTTFGPLSRPMALHRQKWSAVAVAKEWTSSNTLPGRSQQRTQTTTLLLWTSMPAQRGYRVSTAFSRGISSPEDSDEQPVCSACSPRARGQQFRVRGTVQTRLEGGLVAPSEHTGLHPEKRDQYSKRCERSRIRAGNGASRYRASHAYQLASNLVAEGERLRQPVAQPAVGRRQSADDGPRAHRRRALVLVAAEVFPRLRRNRRPFA